MTTALINKMIQDEEKNRRRTRFELGISSAQHGQRVPNKKRQFRKGSRNSWKKEI